MKNLVTVIVLIISIQYSQLSAQSEAFVTATAAKVANQLMSKCEQGLESTDLDYNIISSGKDGFVYIDMVIVWVDKAGSYDHNAKAFRGYAFIDDEVGDGFFVVTMMEEEGVVYNSCYEGISSDHKKYFYDNYGINGIKYIDLGQL